MMVVEVGGKGLGEGLMMPKVGEREACCMMVVEVGWQIG